MKFDTKESRIAG